MLRYMLARFNPERGSRWGINLDWFTNKTHQGYSGSKIWGYISKTWKIMAKSIYQIPRRTRMELLHSNIWWSEGVDLLKKKLSTIEEFTFTGRKLSALTMLWSISNVIFSHGKKHKENSPSPTRMPEIGTF